MVSTIQATVSRIISTTSACEIRQLLLAISRIATPGFILRLPTLRAARLIDLKCLPTEILAMFTRLPVFSSQGIGDCGYRLNAKVDSLHISFATIAIAAILMEHPNTKPDNQLNFLLKNTVFTGKGENLFYKNN